MTDITGVDGIESKDIFFGLQLTANIRLLCQRRNEGVDLKNDKYPVLKDLKRKLTESIENIN